MKIILGAMILIINIYATSRGISNIFIAGILCIVCIAYYVISRKSGNSVVIAFTELMCYTWSSSWRNIFGGYFGNMQIPWFYIIGMIVVLYILFKSRLNYSQSKIPILIAYVFLIIFGFIPVIIAYNFSEALADYVTYSFFLVMTFMFNFTNISFSKAEYNNILKAFVNASLLTSIGIIVQAAIQKTTGIDIVRNVTTEISGGNRVTSALIFADTSSAMICLGVAVMIIIINPKLIRFRYLTVLSIIAGMGLSSTRTGLIALLITFIVYAVFQKSIVKKVKLLVSLSIAGIVGLFTLSFVRDMSNLSDLLNPSGRIEGYIAALKIWYDNPIFGIGFGDGYLTALMNYIPIPHLTLLNLLVQAGIVYVFLFVVVIYYYYRMAKKYNMKTEVYTIFLSVVGSCFIPTLFSARFFTIVIMMVCIRKKIIQESITEIPIFEVVN